MPHGVQPQHPAVPFCLTHKAVSATLAAQKSDLLSAQHQAAARLPAAQGPGGEMDPFFDALKRVLPWVITVPQHDGLVSPEDSEAD